MSAEALATTQTAAAIAQLAIEPGTGLFNCLKREYGYVKDMRKNYDKLLKEYKKLCAVVDDVEERVVRNEIEVEETNQCRLWRGEVQDMKRDVEALEKVYRKAPRWFGGLCYLMKLGRQIVKKTNEVVSLTNERGKVYCLTIKKEPAPHIRNPTNKICEFPTQDENVKKLLKYLRNENTKTIGIWGPIGVGKSTLMNRLHQEMGNSKEFGIVFWIPVGRRRDEEYGRRRDEEYGRRRDEEYNRRRDEEYVQQELLKLLNIKPEDFSDGNKKNNIYEQLNKYSYLLLLDEVFSKIDLENIGISDEHKGKVVFASRYRDVCQRADEEIEVQRLSDPDAQNMFWEKVGVHLKGNPHIKGDAELIIKFCSGMPYLIKLIGNYLANKMRDQPTNADIAKIWRTTKKKLNSPIGVQARIGRSLQCPST